MRGYLGPKTHPQKHKKSSTGTAKTIPNNHKNIPKNHKHNPQEPKKTNPGTPKTIPRNNKKHPQEPQQTSTGSQKHTPKTIQVLRNESESWVLRGLRRNGMLGLRPCWETKRLKKCEGESWCKGMEEVSYRFKKEWLEQRYRHFNEETGRVPPVDWSILGQAKEESELQEQSYCAEQKRLMEETEKDELEIDFDEFENTEEMLAAKVCEILQRPVKERRVATAIDELLSAVIPRGKRSKAKQEKRFLAEQ